MLHHEHQEDAQNAPVLPAAQRRVTPEELNAALEALESNRQEQARQVQQTVAIGDVVEELGLNVTSEEVWRQVEAQRARQPIPPPAAESDSAEAKAADSIHGALHTAAQHARRLAGEASAAAAASLAAARIAQTQEAVARRPRRRRLGLVALVLMVVVGSRWISGGHEGFHVSNLGTPALVINGDSGNVTYNGYHKAVVINGDGETVTLRGGCGSLVVQGDRARVNVIGSVDRVVADGDGDTIHWTQEPGGQSPTIVDNGDGNQISPVASP